MAIFVCGFFVTCSWAIWKLPAWSGQSRHEMARVGKECSEALKGGALVAAWANAIGQILPVLPI